MFKKKYILSLFHKVTPRVAWCLPRRQCYFRSLIIFSINLSFVMEVKWRTSLTGWARSMVTEVTHTNSVITTQESLDINTLPL